MHLHKLSLGVLIALLTPLAPLSFKFPAPLIVPQVLAQTSSSRKAEADRLLQQGKEQFQSSQFQAALQSFQQALSIYREIKDRQGEGSALAGQGGAYLGLQDKAQAIESAQQSLTIAREIDNRQLEAIAQNVLSLAQGQNNPRKSEADRLFLQGKEQFQSSQFQAALQSFQQALSIYREIKDRQGEGSALAGQGSAYLGLQDKAQAIESAQQSLAIAREINNRQLEAVAQNVLSLAQGQNNPRKSEADRLLQQGFQQYQANQFTAALESLEKALQSYREIKNRPGEEFALLILGGTYSSLGNYNKAIEYLNQSLAIARSRKLV